MGRKNRPLTCGFAQMAKNDFKSGQRVSAGRWHNFGRFAHFFLKFQLLIRKVQIVKRKMVIMALFTIRLSIVIGFLRKSGQNGRFVISELRKRRAHFFVVAKNVFGHPSLFALAERR